MNEAKTPPCWGVWLYATAVVRRVQTANLEETLVSGTVSGGRKSPAEVHVTNTKLPCKWVRPTD